MKIAASASGTDLNSQINPRFGRCDYLLIINTDDMSFDICPNEFMNMSSGAGTQLAALAASKGVEAVLTGNCGPKAMDVFNSQNIRVITGVSGTVAEAVEGFKSNSQDSGVPANPSGKSSPNPPAGQGPGSGCRRSGGGGRGMGGGCGRGMGRRGGMGGQP